MVTLEQQVTNSQSSWRFTDINSDFSKQPYEVPYLTNEEIDIQVS